MATTKTAAPAAKKKSSLSGAMKATTAAKQAAEGSKPHVKRTSTKTVMVKPLQVKKQWVLIDANGVILGRLASYVAMVLRGKTKPSYTPSVDCGDNVVIINAEKVRMTGKKAEEKPYYYHTGYVGGIKTRTRAKMLIGKRPEQVITLAVQRMMPHGPLGRQQMTNLRVYKGDQHPHAAQMPKVIDFAAHNPKNKR
jgi:large subunit ribosomal protein L13